MRTKPLVSPKIDQNALRQALDDMLKACGGGDVPARFVRSTANLLKLTPTEFAYAAASINRPFATSHVR